MLTHEFMFNSKMYKLTFFDTDSYELKPESKVELDKLVNFLNDNVALKIELGGHTDNQGSKEHNLLLSKKIKMIFVLLFNTLLSKY